MNTNYDYVLQESNYDCGVACLLTIFKQFGKNITREEIISKINIKEGIRAYDLIEVSKYYKVDAKGLKGNVSKLKQDLLPAIAHVIVNKSYYHYIVILKKKKDALIIMDPAIGIKTIKEEEFDDISTGIFIVFQKEKFKKVRDKRLKKFLLFTYKDNKKYIKRIIVIFLIYIILSLLFSNYLKSIIKYLNSHYLILIISIFLIISIVKNLISLLKNKLINELSNTIDKKIHSKIISHIFFLPYKYFCQKTIGEINVLTNDIENFKDIIIKIFIVLTIDILVIVSSLIYMAFISKIIIPFFIIFIIILVYISKKYQYTLNNNYKTYRKEREKTYSYFINSLIGCITSKTLHIENKLIDNNIKIYKELLNINKNGKTYNNYFEHITNSIVDITYIFIVLIIAIFTKDKVLNIVLFNSLFYFLSPFIFDISNLLSVYKIYETSITKILDLLDIEKENLTTTKLDNIKTIEYKNVSFSYDENKLIENFNLKIKRKENIVITGKSGKGKSSLIKLLLRFYEPNKGKILIDNINIKDLDLDFIRNNITYVSQNEVLFNDTILNNLSIVKNDIEKIQEVVKVVNLKLDLNFLILDNAGNISGGERQKIKIARALLKAKDILILDESFNEIGVKEEKKILLNIFNKYKDLTIILISHRKDNFNLFNKIITVGG